MTKDNTASNMKEEQSRQEWLTLVAGEMEKWFEELSFPVPAYEIRSGFHSSGKRSNAIAEAWLKDGDDQDETYVIFVRPDVEDEVNISASIAHQFCLISVGKRDHSGHLFRHVSISIGLKGRKTETKPGTIFKELLKPVLTKVGKLPATSYKMAQTSTPMRQTTRMKKVECPECGYVARVSRKWIDKLGPPHCPEHGKMNVSE